MAKWLFMVLASLGAASTSAPATAAPQSQRPQCVDVRGEARYRNYGYDHVAVVRNGCDRPVTCDVSTSVNPDVSRVDVPAGASAEVLTFRGSPASEFSVRAECRYSS